MKTFLKISLLIGLSCSAHACMEKPKSMNTMPTLDLVATHAINTERPIKALTFVPNTTAPWLGRILLIGSNSKLYSTDIEGRGMIAVGQQDYTDVLGLSRKNKAGIFITINKNNALGAFIESNDDGEFTAMTYSGSAISALTFCKSPTPTANQIQVLTTKGNIVTLSYTDTNNVIEQTLVSSKPAPKGAAQCAQDGMRIYTASTPSANGTEIGAYKNKAWKKTSISSSVLMLSPHALGQTYLALPTRENISLISASSLEKGYILRIGDGLSIRGLKKSEYLTSTTANYGGGAFKDGVMAVIDADENRIVFISLDYIQRQIAKTVISNTP